VVDWQQKQARAAPGKTFNPLTHKDAIYVNKRIVPHIAARVVMANRTVVYNF